MSSKLKVQTRVLSVMRSTQQWEAELSQNTVSPKGARVSPLALCNTHEGTAGPKATSLWSQLTSSSKRFCLPQAPVKTGIVGLAWFSHAPG